MSVAGESRLQFTTAPFPHLPSECLSFIHSTGTRETRIVIDPGDGATIRNHEGLEWCDVYAKINFAPSVVPKEYVHKCVAIGPSFAIKMWQPTEALGMALRNYRTCVDYSRSAPNANGSLLHFANYRRQYKYRLPLKTYTPVRSKDDYIFFIASLWDDAGGLGVNERRVIFVESCKAIAPGKFEGGFLPSQHMSNSDRVRCSRHMADRRIPFPEYIEKTKASALVFNTPAMWSCHGWKLGEFLALGKAIISTPLTRALPVPLVHGKHIHYVDGSYESINAAVELVLTDREYREFLEANAHEYYANFLDPERVIQRLIKLRDFTAF
jgi:hypothetical protein